MLMSVARQHLEVAWVSYLAMGYSLVYRVEYGLWQIRAEESGESRERRADSRGEGFVSWLGLQLGLYVTRIYTKKNTTNIYRVRFSWVFWSNFCLWINPIRSIECELVFCTRSWLNIQDFDLFFDDAWGSDGVFGWISIQFISVHFDSIQFGFFLLSMRREVLVLEFTLSQGTIWLNEIPLFLAFL